MRKTLYLRAPFDIYTPEDIHRQAILVGEFLKHTLSQSYFDYLTHETLDQGCYEEMNIPMNDFLLIVFDHLPKQALIESLDIEVNPQKSTLFVLARTNNLTEIPLKYSYRIF